MQMDEEKDLIIIVCVQMLDKVFVARAVVTAGSMQNDSTTAYLSLAPS